MEGLLKDYSPEEIAFVSFTKKGSYEGKERAIKKFGFTDKQTPYFRTLHSIAFKELKLKVPDMIDRGDYRDFSHALGMKFIGYYTEELKHNDDAYLFFDQLYRNNPKTADVMLSMLDTDKLRFVRTNYKKFKNQLGLLDFTDIIEIFVEKEIKLPVKVAIIDEAQDLTTLQWKMVFTAFRGCDKIYLAGDDDQAIYEWSGADLNYFLNIAQDDTKILDTSYRLPDNILEYSKRFTNRIKRRVQKDYHGTGKPGAIKRITDMRDLLIDNEQSFMFLSRNNYFLTRIKKYFNDRGMVYNFKNNLSVKKSELDAVVQYNRYKTAAKAGPLPSSVRVHLKNDFDLQGEWYDSFKWTDEKKAYFRDLIKNKVHLEKEIKSNIHINTIHTVKGGEADNVIILQDITKNIKTALEKNPDSEHRIFYVAATRSKKNLYLMQNESKYFYDL